MPSDPQTASDWADETQAQEDIASQIVADAPESTPQVAGTSAPETTDVDEVVEELPQVTLVPVGEDIEYPLTLSVVGAPEGGFVFDGPDSSVDVDPQVAEQVTYLTNVGVAE